MSDNLMNLALTVAKLSPCKRDQVGCAVLSKSGNVFIGFNYHHSGICELSNGETKSDTVHAEQMALSPMEDWSGGELFVTRRPCINCANKILKAGIVKITYITKGNTFGIELLKNKVTLVELPAINAIGLNMPPFEHFHCWTELGWGRAAYVARELGVSRQYINQIHKGVDGISNKRYQEIVHLMIQREREEAFDLRKVKKNINLCEAKIEQLNRTQIHLGTGKEKFVLEELFKWKGVERNLKALQSQI